MDLSRLKVADGQFWDARAGLVAVLASQPGSDGISAAELEWNQLCQPAVPPEPTSPANLILSRVNRATESLLASQLDMSCEDYKTGQYIPCDDAGIPGLGGSSSPCILYTESEVRVRLWPNQVIDQLVMFLSISPEENRRNMARGVMERR